jgi:hypothetical protein
MAKGTPPRALDGLIALIARQNPYTAGQVDDMDLYLRPASPDDPDGTQGSQIELEVDGDYPGEWNFKGQPQKLNRVLRIKYRCKVRRKDSSGNQATTGPANYWMTAYLLIGFEDGGM